MKIRFDAELDPKAASALMRALAKSRRTAALQFAIMTVEFIVIVGLVLRLVYP